MSKQIAMIHGNSTSLARSPSIALSLWYSAKHPDSLPDEPVPYTLYFSETRYPQGGPEFITLVVAACEREFNQTPDYDQDQEFEEQCLDILSWLHVYGDIQALSVR